MPFSHISLPSMGSWPTKNKSTTPVRSRQTSVDLTKVSDDFGIPQADDPDPFGVLALQRAGLLIKEAGTKTRPTSDTFEFRPSPSSPVFRQSGSFSEAPHRLSRRDSKRSNCSTDAGTQTADLPAPESPQGDNAIYLSPTQIASATIPSPVFERTQSESLITGVSKRRSRDGNTSPGSPHGGAIRASPLRNSLTPEGKTDNASDEEKSKAAAVEAAAERKRIRSMSASQRLTESLDKLEQSLPNSAEASPTGSASPDDSDQEVIVESVVTAPAQTVRVMTPTVVSPTTVRAKLVTIKGKPAPAIPARNPRRQRPRAAQAENGGDHLSADLHDESSSAYSLSPTQSAFDRNDDRASIPWSEQTSIPDTDRVSVKSPRATPEPSETVDVSVGADMSENEVPKTAKTGEQPSQAAKESAALTPRNEHVHGLGIDGVSERKTDGSTHEITYVPSAAAHTSPTRQAHLDAPESNDSKADDTTTTTPQPSQTNTNGTAENATLGQDDSAADALSISDYGHDDTQSQYADDEADDGNRLKPQSAGGQHAHDDESETFHSIPATPMRNPSPLDPKAVASKTTASTVTV